MRLRGPMAAFWWNDALLVAQRRAALTGRRHRVTRAASGMWHVSEVGA